VCGKQFLPPLIHGKSRMRKRARTDLCGGRSVMIVPTATVDRVAKLSCWKIAIVLVEDFRRKIAYVPESPFTNASRLIPSASQVLPAS
jgi:hypothetical protein